MKQKLDERQIQEATKIASISFYVMYGVCALAIILQLIVTGRLENVIGETAVIAAGGIVYLSGSVKKDSAGKTLPLPCAAFLKAQSFPPCLQYSMYLLSEEKPDQRQKSVLLSFSFLQGSRFSASSH